MKLDGKARWMRGWWGPGALVMTVAMALRCFRLGEVELWFDESYSGLLSFFTPQDILRYARAEVAPPLYYLTLGAWAGLFGHSETALRALSVVTGSLTALVVYGVARKTSVAAGLAAGMAVALSPLHVQYSRQARMYAMLLLLISGAIACLLRALGHGRAARLRWWAAYALCSAAAIWTHYFAVFALSAGLFVVLGRGRPAQREFGLATAVTVLLSLPLVPWVLVQAHLPATDWIEALYRAIPPPLAIPRTLELFTPGALYPSYPQFRFGPPLCRPMTFLLLSAALIPGVLCAIRGVPEEHRIARAGLAFLILPLVLMSAASILRPIYLPGRYDLVALPGFAILGGVGIARLPRAGRALVALVAVVLAAGSLAPHFRPAMYASVSRAVARNLAPALQPGDVLLFTGYSMPEVRYALLRAGRDPMFRTMPLSSAQHPGWLDLGLLNDPSRRRLESNRAAREAAAMAGGRSVWLLVDKGQPGGRAMIDALESLGLRAAVVLNLVDGPPGPWRRPLYAVAFVHPRASSP